jgi:hypothetical protein
MIMLSTWRRIIYFGDDKRKPRVLLPATIFQRMSELLPAVLMSS